MSREEQFSFGHVQIPLIEERGLIQKGQALLACIMWVIVIRIITVRKENVSGYPEL